MMSATQSQWFIEITLRVSRAIPAAFQYTAEASSATDTKVAPIPAARAPIPIFKNCADRPHLLELPRRLRRHR